MIGLYSVSKVSSDVAKVAHSFVLSSSVYLNCLEVCFGFGKFSGRLTRLSDEFIARRLLPDKVCQVTRVL